MVIRASQADISDNTIDDNGQNGIFVSQGSGFNLGNDTGNTIFDLPNSGINGAIGLSCSIGGYVDGVKGETLISLFFLVSIFPPVIVDPQSHLRL
jgi:hypothetical protein